MISGGARFKPDLSPDHLRQAMEPGTGSVLWTLFGLVTICLLAGLWCLGSENRTVREGGMVIWCSVIGLGTAGGIFCFFTVRHPFNWPSGIWMPLGVVAGAGAWFACRTTHRWLRARGWIRIRT